ncbi:hypothetical protein Lepto7375DRAFT_0634, partial [Leptolyngbya sp. PCC 7375]
ALKIRRLRFLTLRRTSRQLTRCQSVVLLVTFALARILTFPLSSVSSLGHLQQASPAKVSSVSGWVLPYPSSYQGLALFPAPFRVTAFASLTSSPPLGYSAFLAVCLPRETTFLPRTQWGLACFALSRYNIVRSQLYSGKVTVAQELPIRAGPFCLPSNGRKTLLPTHSRAIVSGVSSVTEPHR